MESLLEYIKQRSVSTLLISYSVFWVIYHWEGVYASIFTSQEYIFEKYGLLKNEYVGKFFLGIHQDNILNWFCGIVVPAILSILYVWLLPKILINPSYRREIKFKVDRKEMKIKEEKRLVTEERKKVEEESKGAMAKIELNKRKAEINETDPEHKWKEDYSEFLGADTNAAFIAMKELKDSIYSYNGHINDNYGMRCISDDSLMRCDTNGLITFNKANRSRIDLTDKGKFFLKEFAKRQI